jgi:hypothetical protein
MLEMMIPLFAQAGLDQDLLFTLPTAAVRHHTQLFLLRWGFMNFLPRLAWNCNSLSE